METPTVLTPPGEISVIPGDFADLFDQYAPTDELSDTEWITKLDLHRPRRNLQCLSRGAQLRKRVVDVVGALVLLTVTAPVVVVAAVLVKITSPGPLIYKQLRVGVNLRGGPKKDRRQTDAGPPGDERRVANSDRRLKKNFGRPFVLYKFRSMRIDAERNGAQLASKNDPRVTRIGRFMRLTRIDELPQLINVLKGDMSLVGPRPERPFFIEQLTEEIPNYLNRLGLKPGVTGVAQVLNGYDNDIESFRRKVAYDLLYLQNCCLWNDFKILFKTIWVVVTGHGAR